MASLPTPQKYRAFTAGNAGAPVRPLVGGKLYTYEAGTTTPKVTYTDATETTQNQNPVILNSRGEADVWLGLGSYKFVLTDATGVTESVTDGIKSSGQYLQDALDANDSLRADLASNLVVTKGAGMVGYAYNATPPAGSVADALNDRISVMQFIPSVQRAAIRAGSSTYDCTPAFNAAIATGRAIYIPNGKYQVSDIAVVQGMDLAGESTAVVMEVRSNNGSVFLHSAATDLLDIRLSRMTWRAAPGVTGAKGFRQTDKSVYTAYAQFDTIETWRDLAISFDGYFIYTVWCGEGRDGYNGTVPVGQQHQFLSSIPATWGQFRQSNHNGVYGWRVFECTAGAPAAVDVAYGDTWRLEMVSFERNACTHVRMRGIFQATLENCRHENPTSGNAPLWFDSSPSPNPQGCRAIEINGGAADLSGYLGTEFLHLDGASVASVRNISTFNVPSGVKLTDSPARLGEVYNVEAVSGPGAATFMFLMQARRSNMLISASELGDGVTSAPTMANQNILPIGPGGLGQANFTLLNASAKSDVASGIGLAGNAVSVTLSGLANAAYYTLPSKLVTFLQGKTVTLVCFVYGGTAAVADALGATVWDSVVPIAGNGVMGVTANAASTALQVTYVTVTVGASATALRVGITTGGSNNGQTVILETMALYLGVIKPQGMSIR